MSFFIVKGIVVVSGASISIGDMFSSFERIDIYLERPPEFTLKFIN